jgi:hypothetical protein
MKKVRTEARFANTPFEKEVFDFFNKYGITNESALRKKSDFVDTSMPYRQKSNFTFNAASSAGNNPRV